MQSRPERVGLSTIEGEIERLHLPDRSCHMQRLTHADVVRQAHDQRPDRRKEPADDDGHLLDVGPRDCLHAALHRVEDGREDQTQES